MTSTSQKERARKVIPGGTRKKDSSAKSLDDIKKSILRLGQTGPWIGSMDPTHGSDPWIKSMDLIHGSDPNVPRESQKGPKETQASPKVSQETPRHFATKTS